MFFNFLNFLQEWDYVFDVTTEDGRVLKLPYNVGEDTNWAAQRFVEKHNLPIKFLEKVSFNFFNFYQSI